jgi:uncharacterized protein YraI
MKINKIKIIFPLIIIIFLIFACGDSTGQNEETEPEQTETKITISLTPTTTQIIPTVTPSITPTPSPLGNATVTVNNANLRSGPGTTFEVVASSKFNEVLPVYGKDKDSQWVIIDLKEGIWISTMIVDLDVDINSIPVYEDEMNVTKSGEIFDDNSTNNDSSNYDDIETENSNIFNNKIELISYSTYYSSTGDLIVLGEVMNIGESVLKSVEVTITLRDEDGNLLDFDSSYVYTPWQHNLWNTGVLYPDELAPFRISFDDAGKWVELIPDVDFVEARESDYRKHYRDITIINHVGRSVNTFIYNYQITGELENTGDLSSGDVWIVATLYDNQNKIVGFDESLTDFDLLNPRDIKPFKVEIYARGKVDHYKLYYYAILK